MSFSGFIDNSKQPVGVVFPGDVYPGGGGGGGGGGDLTVFGRSAPDGYTALFFPIADPTGGMIDGTGPDVSFAIPYLTPVVLPEGGGTGYVASPQFIIEFRDENTNISLGVPYPTGGFMVLAVSCPSPPGSTSPFLTVPAQTFDFATLYNYRSLRFNTDFGQYIPSPQYLTLALGLPTVPSLSLSLSWKNLTFDRPIVGNLRCDVDAFIFSKIPSLVLNTGTTPPPTPPAGVVALSNLTKSVNPSSRSSEPHRLQFLHRNMNHR